MKAAVKIVSPSVPPFFIKKLTGDCTPYVVYVTSELRSFRISDGVFLLNLPFNRHILLIQHSKLCHCHHFV